MEVYYASQLKARPSNLYIILEIGNIETDDRDSANTYYNEGFELEIKKPQ